MLSTVPERSLLRVRAVLAAGWLVLIASLLWDPLTPGLTDPANTASPFRLATDHAVIVQGQPVAQAPYAMGNRIFWTMLIPVIPLFLMVAGHEAWRRVCPLSWWSQLPRRLGWQRRRAALNRRSGAIERKLALPARGGAWLRNALLVQFGLLFSGLTARLLFVNAERTALAVFLLGVIAAAVAVGWAWGGKTWCHAVCPVGVVQRIYSGPGGLLESRPHLGTVATPQSSCRRPGPGGAPDVNTCVGCTPSCPDTDLEKTYWESVLDPRVRAVHYGFIGLIWGFYGYYRAYAGNWDYYFSGVWTHERGTWAALQGPGFAGTGLAAAVPKWLAAPLFLAGCVALALAAGWLAERLLRRLAARFTPALDAATLQHRLLVTCAWLAINSFYLFGGRPNLQLLPAPALRAVDIVIVLLTTLWLVRAWGRSRDGYRKESRAGGLRRQLEGAAGVPLQFHRVLDGRGPAQLNADEVDVLARVLPAQSAAVRHEAFRQALATAVGQHQLASPETRRQLRELRELLGVTPPEQTAWLAELGWTAPLDEASDTAGDALSAVADNWLRLDNHRVACEAVVLPAWQPGLRLAQVLAVPAVRERLQVLRQVFGLNEAEHAQALAVICSAAGTLAEQAQQQIQRITALMLDQWQAQRAQGRPLQPAPSDLDSRIAPLLDDCLARLAALDDPPHARRALADLASLVPPQALADALVRLDEALPRLDGVLARPDALPPAVTGAPDPAWADAPAEPASPGRSAWGQALARKGQPPLGASAA